MDPAAPFQLVAGHLAVDFANTLDNRYHESEPLELLSSFDRLIGFCRQSNLIAERQARRLLRETETGEAERILQAGISLREALHALFQNTAAGQPPSKPDLDILNHFLTEASSTRSLVWQHGRYAWRDASSLEMPGALLYRISQAAATLLASEDRSNLRECGARTCRWLFLDHSKNHSRRWCDMKLCGNRAKARSFQDRQKTA